MIIIGELYWCGLGIGSRAENPLLKRVSILSLI